jgi:hypothetical protein
MLAAVEVPVNILLYVLLPVPFQIHSLLSFDATFLVTNYRKIIIDRYSSAREKIV